MCEVSYAKFREKKSSQNAKNTLSFSDICKSCPSHKFFSITNVLTLFAKISGFTVVDLLKNMAARSGTHFFCVCIGKNIKKNLALFRNNLP